jgi:hypothetical protein
MPVTRLISTRDRGRPVGSRQRLSEQLLADIAQTWAEHGQSVLTRLVAEDPAKFASLAFAIAFDLAMFAVAWAMWKKIALPTPAAKKADSALWLWIAIVVIAVLAVAVVVGALVYVQSFS